VANGRDELPLAARLISILHAHVLPPFSDFIAKHHRLSEVEARLKFWQIISAIEYCHNLNIVHRDLKVSPACFSGMRARADNNIIHRHFWAGIAPRRYQKQLLNDVKDCAERWLAHLWANRLEHDAIDCL
jgi:hypothetical protein